MAILSLREKNYIFGLGLISLMCLGLFGLRVAITGSTRYAFVPGNLMLAWASLVAAWLLIKRLKTSRWQTWQNIIITVIWLGFLPNAWYVLTDFIHVYPNGEISQLYDIVLISSLVFSAFILGITSLHLFHRELYKRFNPYRSYFLVEAAILLSSFAVYLGRDLRWNTWDAIVNPGGLIVNISDRIADPLGNPRALDITLLFFILISILYGAAWSIFGPNESHTD